MVSEQTRANRVETAINLRRQIRGLEDVSDSEFLIIDTSPPARWETLYSMLSGEEIRVKHFRVESVLMKTDPSGNPLFTSFKEQAPVYRQGSTRCFLADDSPERQSGVLTEIGMADKVCPAKKLANEFAKEEHARHKHRSEFRVYEAYLERQEKDLERAERRHQTDAMLSLVTGRAQLDVYPKPRKVATGEFTCEDCGKVLSTKLALAGHKRSHNKEG